MRLGRGFGVLVPGTCELSASRGRGQQVKAGWRSMRAGTSCIWPPCPLSPAGCIEGWGLPHPSWVCMDF